jgi:hypothetical protein
VLRDPGAVRPSKRVATARCPVVDHAGGCLEDQRPDASVAWRHCDCRIQQSKPPPTIGGCTKFATLRSNVSPGQRACGRVWRVAETHSVTSRASSIPHPSCAHTGSAVAGRTATATIVCGNTHPIRDERAKMSNDSEGFGRSCSGTCLAQFNDWPSSYQRVRAMPTRYSRAGSRVCGSWPLPHRWYNRH